MVHQVFVRVIGLQSGNECGFSDIIATVQCHLTLEMTDVALEGFSLHLDREEVVVLLKLLH